MWLSRLCSYLPFYLDSPPRVSPTGFEARFCWAKIFANASMGLIERFERGEIDKAELTRGEGFAFDTHTMIGARDCDRKEDRQINRVKL